MGNTINEDCDVSVGKTAIFLFKGERNVRSARPSCVQRGDLKLDEIVYNLYMFLPLIPLPFFRCISRRGVKIGVK